MKAKSAKAKWENEKCNQENISQTANFVIISLIKKVIL